MDFLKKLVVATITFLVLDLIWLGFVAKSLYQYELKNFLSIVDGNLQANMLSGLIVYILLIGGILIFPVAKANGVARLALIYGAVFGLVTYGTYGFTNHALVSGWPQKIAVVDTLWGAFLCGVTSFVTVYILGK